MKEIYKVSTLAGLTNHLQALSAARKAKEHKVCFNCVHYDKSDSTQRVCMKHMPNVKLNLFSTHDCEAIEVASLDNINKEIKTVEDEIVLRKLMGT